VAGIPRGTGVPATGAAGADIDAQMQAQQVSNLAAYRARQQAAAQGGDDMPVEVVDPIEFHRRQRARAQAANREEPTVAAATKAPPARRDPTRPPAPARPSGRPTTGGGRGSSSPTQVFSQAASTVTGGGGAGFALGLIAAAAVINYLRGTFGQWLSAKLTNQTS